MPEDKKTGLLREHEKFWSFIFLIITIVGLVWLASTFDQRATTAATDLVIQAKLRIIDAAITGLLTITGMAAQALFRISSTDQKNAVTFARALDKLPEEPKKVIVDNPPEKPANVTETQPVVEDLPEYAR